MRRPARWLAATVVVVLTPLGLAPATATSVTPAVQGRGFDLVRIGGFPLGSSAGASGPAMSGIQTLSPSGGGATGGHGVLAAHRSLARRPSFATASAPLALAPPLVAPSEVHVPGANLASSFQGLDLFQQRSASNGNQFSLEPPDQGLCAGNGFTMETVNDVIRVFNAHGAPLTDPIAMNQFYGYAPEIDRVHNRFGPEPTDPSCYFDAATSRWFHIALVLGVDPVIGQLTLRNHLALAVSDTASPLGAWHFYKLPVQDDGTAGTPVHPGCPCVGDYPHIGFDGNGIYITTNEYPFSSAPGIFGNNFNGAQLYAASTSALASGQAHVPVVTFGPLVRSDGRPGFTVWPAEATGHAVATQHGGTEYFLNSSATPEALNTTGMDNHLGVWALTNTRSLNTTTPQLQLFSVTLKSETYGVPPLSAQKAGATPLADCLLVQCFAGLGPSRETEAPIDSGDSRMQQVWYADGLLYGALGTIQQVGGNLQAGVAWFVVDPSGSLSSASITRQGYLAGERQTNLVYPAISVLDDGHGVMAMTIVGPNFFPSAGYAGVSGLAVGEPQLAAAGQGAQDGFCGYVFFNCGQTPTPSSRPRWGDYGAAVPDGAGHLLVASEYIGQTCTFATYRRDPTCGGTRSTLGNWSTRISTITP